MSYDLFSHILKIVKWKGVTKRMRKLKILELIGIDYWNRKGEKGSQKLSFETDHSKYKRDGARASIWWSTITILQNTADNDNNGLIEIRLQFITSLIAIYQSFVVFVLQRCLGTILIFSIYKRIEEEKIATTIILLHPTAINNSSNKRR